MHIQYDVIIRPIVYLIGIIVFWQLAKRKRSGYWPFVAVMSSLFVVSMALTVFEVQNSHDEVISVGDTSIPYMMVKAVLENLGLFAIVVSLVILLTRRLHVARKEVSQLARIAASSADAIIGFDTTGTITTWNRGAEMVFGYIADEIIGQKIHRLVSEEYQAELDAARERCPGEGFVRGLSWRMIGKGSRQTLSEVTVSPINDEDGLLVGTSLFIRDVTEQKEMEKELLQASKMTAMGTMAAGVVQEFGNLLTVISSRVQLAFSAQSLEEARQEFEAISTCASRAKSITNNLLAYAKRQRPVKTTGFLSDAADTALALMEKELERARITVTRRYDPMPNTAFDRDQIVQVFVNIIMNAVTAMRETGGKIEVSITKKQGYLEAAVRDNGPGIKPDLMTKLFEPFSNESSSGEDAKTGLGLFVCRQIVKFHNGNITIESRPKEGTTLKFYLPVTSRDEAAASTQDTRIIDMGKCSVAVVDRDVMIRELLAQALRRRGLVTETFPDAESAHKAGVAERFSVAFVDLSVRTDGDKRYIEELKNDPSRILIGMIGEAVDPEELRRIEDGLFRTLRKPFGLEEIDSICGAIKPAGDTPNATKRAA